MIAQTKRQSRPSRPCRRFVRLLRHSQARTRPTPENRTLRQRAGALRARQTQKKNGCRRISAEGEAASGEAGQSRGVVRAPRRSHLPAVRAVSEICEGVVERAKIAPVGSQFEKSQTFQGKQWGCTKKVHVKRKKQQVQRWVKNSEFTEKNSLQAEKLASCLLKNLRFTAPEIQPESVGRSSAEII